MTEGRTIGTGGHLHDETGLPPLWTTALALGIGAIGGALIGARLARAKAGDEAPIRVKNGSIELQLLNNNRTFVMVGTNRKHWRVSGGDPRELNEYALRVEAIPGACSGTALQGNNVRYTHSDGHWVQIVSNGRRTQIIASAPLIVSDEHHRLVYASHGHVVSIGVGGHEHCTFSAPGELHAVYMTEP